MEYKFRADPILGSTPPREFIVALHLFYEVGGFAQAIWGRRGARPRRAGGAKGWRAGVRAPCAPAARGATAWVCGGSGALWLPPVNLDLWQLRHIHGVGRPRGHC